MTTESKFDFTSYKIQCQYRQYHFCWTREVTVEGRGDDAADLKRTDMMTEMKNIET